MRVFSREYRAISHAQTELLAAQREKGPASADFRAVLDLDRFARADRT
jgi:hypothetical protein